MPRVPKATHHRVDASPDTVRGILVERLDAQPHDDGTLFVGAPPGEGPGAGLTITLAPDDSGAGCTAHVTQHGGVDIPFFALFFRPLVVVEHRRLIARTFAMIEAALHDGPDPEPVKPVFGLPPVAFSNDQAVLLAAASAATAVVSFASALFGQLSGPISDAFGASDARISVLLAVTRAGALIALFITALADRRGRRRSILIGVVGSAACCAASAAAPNLLVLTSAQIVQRGLLITTATVAGIAVIEESPEGARAYAASMLALAGGLGFSIAVVVLPFADIGTSGWRIPYALGALSVLLAPPIARKLRETTRYTRLSARADVVRGRVRDIWRRHRRRFVLLAAAAFLANVFNAPSSQLMNKYLTDDRGFSNTGVAVFRAVTTAVPGLVGLLLGGRLAEARGRRPVAAIAIAIASVTQVVFFLFGGSLIWVMSAASIFAASAGGIALGTLDAELFPTEVRSTSNAMLNVIAVLGSVAGFGVVGALSDPLNGLGRAIAVTGIAAFAAAVFVIPLLPESAAHSLDEVSPTETGFDP